MSLPACGLWLSEFVSRMSEREIRVRLRIRRAPSGGAWRPPVAHAGCSALRSCRHFGDAVLVHLGHRRGVSGVLAFTLEFKGRGHRGDSDLPITAVEGLFLATVVLFGGFGCLLCHFGSMELIVFLSPR